MFKKLVIVVLSSITLYAAGGPSLVETTKIIKGEVNPLQEFVGTLKFDRNSVLAAQNSGVVQKINFEVGDIVKEGKTLVQIDADILNAQVESARANALNAQRDYQRYTKLLETKSISQKQYDDIKLNAITTKSTLNELEIEKKKKSINAPYSGIVVEKSINLGEWVNAGTALLSIVDTSKAEITFNVPLNIFNGLKKGAIYDINVGENILKGKMSGAIPSGDKLTRTFPVKFKANTKNVFVFDGQEASVSLSKNAKQESLIVPRDAVIKRFGKNIVFIIDDKMIAQMIPVQVIAYLESKVAIKAEGLTVGQDVVTKGNERVFPNSPVKIINN
ncbi:efflux RND transporter periplasmic adaptor subunit [Arcobacter sp.]|uniref:efflux RND transporter periplasmic adaptor subunit n=1 Tax=unclassified Arcobacter TaxID=2593671 RepID=UPI003B0080E6|eukprot:TRINITY_DN4877_c0_g1_i5.p1 TRINITY_DN4877_c0_g1~~TRINITY_DN4877_c0_g1_i5.p1  ORF type:complete len:332 (+),score=-43.10 TRINITY_DN4877_c0_g1_i5:931-1926(+)